VGEGYWRDPAATADAFGFALAGRGAGWLRTGDLGRLLDGNLHVVGRAKDVIVVRGTSLHATDVEHAVSSACPDVPTGSVAAFALPGDSGRAEGLGVVVGYGPGAGPAEDLLARVRQAVSGRTGVAPAAVHLVARPHLARTTSGKLRRADIRHGVLAGLVPVTASWPGPGRPGG
jgi:acyl-CoA synthetase (AMP-forming)/AMP-acid ligase II